MIKSRRFGRQHKFSYKKKTQNSVNPIYLKDLIIKIRAKIV